MKNWLGGNWFKLVLLLVFVWFLSEIIQLDKKGSKISSDERIIEEVKSEISYYPPFYFASVVHIGGVGSDLITARAYHDNTFLDQDYFVKPVLIEPRIF